VDQFKRASFSIVLNIAEGAGKLKRADKQRYFSIARGSVMECGALFDLLNALSYVSPDEYRAGKRLLARIAAMLSKLCLQSAWHLFRVRSRLRARARSRDKFKTETTGQFA
jgi:four helix bundle protein